MAAMTDALPHAGETKPLLIDGPVGSIDALLSAPRGEARGIAVIAHPHPLFGGAMSNKVTYTLASCAQSAGLYALRFNFRGVGRSVGAHDFGRGETDDVVFLAGWLRERFGQLPLLLAGFSFGAWVTTNAAIRLAPTAQLSIAPPFAKYFDDLPLPQRPPCPWLVVHGIDDDTVNYDDTVAVLKSYQPPPQLVTMDGVGHFFHGRLVDLTAQIKPFLDTQFAVPA